MTTDATHRTHGREPLWEGRSLGTEAAAFLRLIPVVVGSRMRLLGFELRRAGRDLVGAVVLIAAAIFLACTAWAACWVGVAMALRSVDLSWPVVVAVVVLVNAGGAALAVWGAVRLAGHVKLPATMRHLSFADGADSTP